MFSIKNKLFSPLQTSVPLISSFWFVPYWINSQRQFIDSNETSKCLVMRFVFESLIFLGGAFSWSSPHVFQQQNTVSCCKCFLGRFFFVSPEAQWRANDPWMECVSRTLPTRCSPHVFQRGHRFSCSRPALWATGSSGLLKMHLKGYAFLI